MDFHKTIKEVSKSLSNLGGVGREDTKVVPTTEAAIGMGIAESASKNGFRKGEDALFLFNGIKYDKLSKNDIESFVYGLLKELNIGAVYINKSIECIIKHIYRSVDIETFAPSKSIISFRNCCLNIKTMQTSPHGPNIMTRTFLDFDYDPSARCDLWEDFLVRMLRDYGSRLILQEFLGMMFIDPTEFKEAKACFLFGTGANGKSVVADTLSDMLGSDNCSHYSLQQLCVANDSAYYLAKANGKLLNYAQDMSDKDFSGGIWKTIAAREPLEARPIGQAPFTANDLPVLMANINKIPQTTDSTSGHWRRFLILHFDVTLTPKEQDKTLPTKIRKEVSGIFNWILQGRERLLRNDGVFSESKIMKDLIRRSMVESNSVLSFLDEKGYVGLTMAEGKLVTRMKMSSVDLMSEYRNYCLTWNNVAKSKTNFFNDLKQAGFEYQERVRINGSSPTTGFMFYKLDPSYALEIGQSASSPNEDGRILDLNEDPSLPF